MCIIIILTIISCRGKKENVTISGSFKDAHPPVIYLKEISGQGITNVDSSSLNEKGEFLLHAYTTTPVFYVLWVPESRGINLLAFPGDNIKVYINSNEFDIDYNVEGSVESRRISKLIKQQHKTLDQITELSNRYEKIRRAADFAVRKAKLDSIYDIIMKNHKKFSEDFIAKDPCSLVNLMVLDQQLGRSAPVFDIKSDFGIYERVDSCLSARYPSSPMVLNLNRKVVTVREEIRTGPGTIAPELALPDTAGNIISLSSLKNKYVLLVFWASWCEECLGQSVKLAKIYHNIPRDSLQVFQISLDKTKKSWIYVLNSGNYDWINVSDLKYWNSEAARIYVIKKIPMYILVDEHKRILMRTADFSEIEMKLTEIQ